MEEKGPFQARSLSSPVSHHFGGSWYVIDLHSSHTQAGGPGVGCGHTSREALEPHACISCIALPANIQTEYVAHLAA